MRSGKEIHGPQWMEVGLETGSETGFISFLVFYLRTRDTLSHTKSNRGLSQIIFCLFKNQLFVTLDAESNASWVDVQGLSAPLLLSGSFLVTFLS